MKKTFLTIISIVMMTFCLSCRSKEVKPQETKTEPTKKEKTFNEALAIKDANQKKLNPVSGIDILADMKTGWNLGNTMETNGTGLEAETYWGQPKTTKAMFDGLVKAGFKTVRIPASWSNHLIDQNYTIDPKWMARVKEIVDWAIEDDMYVILNTHHDNYQTSDINAKMPYGKGYYPSEVNKEESELFLKNTWAQIALAFNNGYDEHLVFETMNEPRLCGTDIEWSYSSSDARNTSAQKIINSFNQVCVDTIRASGGNNATRLIMVPGYDCSPSSVMSQEFVIPEDKAKNVGVTVHMYTPYNFAGDGNGTREYTTRMANELASTFKALDRTFKANGIPVYIGEYGATNKDNQEDRIKWFHTFIRQTTKLGIPCFLWDNQVFEKDSSGYSEKFGYYIREKQEWFVPEITETIMNATVLE